RPRLVMLDDLHWADLPSLHMLAFLAHELPDVPILLVGTFREVDARRAPAVAEVIDRVARHARRLPLAGFTVPEVVRFLEASAGEHVSQGLAERLRRDTEGNPFFLDELVRHFRGAGWWLSPTSGPPLSDGVRSAIRQRLAPLADPTLQ